MAKSPRVQAPNEFGVNGQAHDALYIECGKSLLCFVDTRSSGARRTYILRKCHRVDMD